MPNRLDIPSELNSLIEKRDGEDRRQTEEENSSTNEAASEQPSQEVDKERRSGVERRQTPKDAT